MKKLLIFFIVIAVIPIQICGILLLAFGATVFSSMSRIETLQYHPVLLTITILGAIIFLVTLFGSFGAIRESYCMSMTYSILLFTLMIGEMVLIAFLWFQKDKFIIIMNNAIQNAWDIRHTNSFQMDLFQKSFECCGRDSSSDYNSQTFVPASCCNRQPCILTNAYEVGCKEVISNFWDDHYATIKYPILVIAALEFIGSLFAGYLAYSVKTKVGKALILPTTSSSIGKE